MYKLKIDKKAFEFLETLPTSDIRLFYNKLEIVLRNPYAQIPFAKKLKNSSYYRFRFRQYRCVYNIIDDIITVEVIKIDNRKEIYRRLK